MSTIGVVSTLNAPLLGDITQPSLIKFEVEYAGYLEHVEDVNSSRSAANRTKPASIRLCIRPKLLQSLYILGEINGAETVKEGTDDNVKERFQRRSNMAPKDMAERIRSAIDSVKYTVCSEDPGEAAMRFVLSVTELLDNKNASDIIKDKSKCKIVINKLVNKIEPPELKMRIINERTFWSEEEKESLQHFMKRTSVLAVKVHNGEVARKQIPPGGKSKRKLGVETVSPNRGVKSRFKKHRKSGDDVNNTDREPLRKEPSKDRWNKQCLNSEGSGIHRVKDCPITSSEKCKELLKKYRDEHKKSLKSMSSVKPSEGRYEVILNDSLNCPALCDYGADFSAIQSSDLDKLLHSSSNIVVETLQSHLRLQLAVSDEKAIATASRKVTIQITIMLPGCGLPFRLQSVEFLVMDQKMTEVLIGRPFLHTLDFNFEFRLTRVRSVVNNRSIDELQKSPSTLAALAYKGMTYRDEGEDPIEVPENLATRFGNDTFEKISDAFAVILQDAKNKGISGQGYTRMQELLEKYRSIFGIKLGDQPPANIEPMHVTLKENSLPVRSPQRRYANKQKYFLSETILQLETIGAVYKNPSAKWASPALAVPKPGTDTLRFTVYLRIPNFKTVPCQPALPHLESLLQECSGSRVFANVDFCHGYWQVPLAQDSQEIFSIQTPLGVFSPTRILQGGTDSANHFQSVTQAALSGRVQRLIQWLDDFLLHVSSETELLDDVEKFFEVCGDFNLRIHAVKSRFFLIEVKFCGRIIDKSGIRFDSRNMELLTNMGRPKTGADLQQFICATNWMRDSIPKYTGVIHPLHELMESIYAKSGKRTKNAVKSFQVDESWGHIHEESFKKVRQELSASLKLAHPKLEQRACLFTDASDTHWAAIITQIPENDRRHPVEEQRHEPLCFLSDAFSGSSKDWKIPEKEGFAIVESFCRLDYLIVGRQVSVYTDHRNLLYIYDPLGANPKTQKHTASKLTRWAMRLGPFDYVIEHMPGEQNVWADMLTRWAASANLGVKIKNKSGLKALLQASISPEKDEFDWPPQSEIIRIQRQSKSEVPSRAMQQDGV